MLSLLLFIFSALLAQECTHIVLSYTGDVCAFTSNSNIVINASSNCDTAQELAYNTTFNNLTECVRNTTSVTSVCLDYFQMFMCNGLCKDCNSQKLCIEPFTALSNECPELYNTCEFDQALVLYGSFGLLQNCDYTISGYYPYREDDCIALPSSVSDMCGFTTDISLSSTDTCTTQSIGSHYKTLTGMVNVPESFPSQCMQTIQQEGCQDVFRGYACASSCSACHSQYYLRNRSQYILCENYTQYMTQHCPLSLQACNISLENPTISCTSEQVSTLLHVTSIPNTTTHTSTAQSTNTHNDNINDKQQDDPSHEYASSMMTTITLLVACIACLTSLVVLAIVLLYMKRSSQHPTSSIAMEEVAISGSRSRSRSRSRYF